MDDLERWCRETFVPVLGELPTTTNQHGATVISYFRLKQLAAEKLGDDDPRVQELRGRLKANQVAAMGN